MDGIEFYILDDELWYITADGRNERLDESNVEKVKEILSMIREYYPEAYASLASTYSKSAANVPYYQYLIVRRFCKCNFGNLDTNKFDVNARKFDFEKVACPLRGECLLEGKVCMPKFNSTLSPAEMRVMNLVFHNRSNDEIVEALSISPNTLKNHIKSVYTKLGIHEKSEFIRYAMANNMFAK